jgi:hypothetical protein
MIEITVVWNDNGSGCCGVQMHDDGNDDCDVQMIMAVMLWCKDDDCSNDIFTEWYV